MTKPRILYRPQAWHDAIDVALYIAADNVEAAERFLKAFESTCDHLAAMPAMGMRQHLKDATLYELHVFPIHDFEKYLIFYQPLGGDIEIIRVIHGARDYPSFFGE